MTPDVRRPYGSASEPARLTDKRQKTGLVGVRLTPEEQAELNALAARLRVTRPEALRLAFRAALLTEGLAYTPLLDETEVPR